MLPEIGFICLIVAFVMALGHTLLLAGRCIKADMSPWVDLSSTFSLAQCFLLTLSFLVLVWAFWSHDYSVHYVAQHAHDDLPAFYLIGAVWGGHEGSLLLWGWILSVWLLAVSLGTRGLPAEIRLTVQSILSLLLSGFLGMILFTSNPFARLLPNPPLAGADLNPILQDPIFIIHPPILYIGYVGLAIPFAFAMAECFNRRSLSGKDWSAWVRPWVLVAMSALTVGITLGSWWAYYELGWGGWWFWDPVENASLMPWIAGCAFLHILWVSRREGWYTNSRLMLSFSVFILSVLGTFLTRSGILSTVHAFASDKTRGYYLLLYLSGIILLATLAFIVRQPVERDPPLPAPVSKSALMGLGAILFAVATASVLLGTLYPLLAEALWDQTLSIGAPYFNTVIMPIMWVALVLMAIAPHLRLKQELSSEDWQTARKHLFPLLIGVVVIVAWGLMSLSVMAWCSLLLVWLLCYSMLIQIPRLWRQPMRWGYWFSHMGFVVLALGIILSVSFESERTLSLSPGETVRINNFALTLQSLNRVEGPNYEGLQAQLRLRAHDKTVLVLKPEKRYFKTRDLVTTESALGCYHLTDFYIALGEPLGDDRWSLRFYIKPFVRLIWLGGLLIGFGIFCSQWFKRPVTRWSNLFSRSQDLMYKREELS